MYVAGMKFVSCTKDAACTDTNSVSRGALPSQGSPEKETQGPICLFLVTRATSALGPQEWKNAVRV